MILFKKHGTMNFKIKHLIIILLIFSASPAKSCYWGPYAEDLRVFIFAPSTYGTQGLSPFYYTSDLFNGDFISNENAVPDENIDEWYEILNKNVDKNSIIELVYKIKFEELERLISGKAESYEKVSENKMSRYLLKNNREDILKYILFAKNIQNLLTTGGYWEEINYDYNEIEKQIKIAQKEAEKTKDGTLKERYTYQAIVLMRYSSLWQEAVDSYKKIFAGNSKESIIKYWALSHVAFCEMNLGEDKKSQLDYIEVFTNCNAKKFYAYSQIKDKYVDSLLNTNIDKNLYHNILVYRQFRNPGKSLSALKKIAKTDVNSKLFTALLVRELNKIEDWLLTRKYTDSEPAILYWNEPSKAISINYETDFKYLADFINFMENSVLKSSKIKNKGRIQLILAHLYFLHEEPQKAKKHISEAEKNIKTHKEQIQLHYTKILVNLTAAKKYDEKFEDKIWTDINWLILDKKNNYKENKNFTNLTLTLHQAYHSKKMYAKAGAFLNLDLSLHSGWGSRWWEYNSAFLYLDDFASAEEVEKFIKMTENPNKSNLDKFLLGENMIGIKDEYYDLQGTIELRNNNLEKALEYYKKADKNFWFTNNEYKYYLSQNPFSSEKVKPDYMFKADSSYVNKAFFTEKLISKIKKYDSTKGEEKAETAILISNVYYNMSYFGTHWYYCSYGWSSTGTGLDYAGYNKKVNDNYRNCTTAINYLKKALELTQNKQTKAKINYIMSSIINDTMRFKDNKTVNDAVISLREKYPDEYEMYLEECPGLKYF